MSLKEVEYEALPLTKVSFVKFEGLKSGRESVSIFLWVERG